MILYICVYTFHIVLLKCLWQKNSYYFIADTLRPQEIELCIYITNCISDRSCFNALPFTFWIFIWSIIHMFILFFNITLVFVCFYWVFKRFYSVKYMSVWWYAKAVASSTWKGLVIFQLLTMWLCIQSALFSYKQLNWYILQALLGDHNFPQKTLNIWSF